MKMLFLVAAIFLSKVFTPAHDIPIAIFHITESSGVLKIDIVFDLDDLSESLDLKTSEINLEKVQNYVTEHTSFQFNDRVLQLKLYQFESNRDHLKVRGNFEETVKSIKTIKVENRCLNRIPRHSNIIQIDLNDKSKDFRMHKARTVINLAY